ncbi:MAG: TolC family protein [Flavobacteriales bacterium]|nr:TolC family protein [Flavobacteriales bacterium]
MKTTYFYIFLFISTINPCISQNLDEYLKAAAENNPGLKAKYAEFEAAMQRVVQVNTLPDPTLSFGYFISPVETRVGPQRAKFGLSQMFPWFGTLAAKGEMTSLMAEAKYQEFLNAKNELYYHVKAAWYPLYETNKLILLQQENIEILTTFKQIATTSFKNGQGSMTDAIRTDIMMENIQTDIRLLQDKKTPLRARFNTLLNRPDTIQITMPDSIVLNVIETAYRKDSLLSANPILEAFNLKLRSALAQEEVARKQGLPKFGVGLDYVVVGEGTMTVPNNGKDVLMPMVSMSLPIFRGKYKAAVKEAQFTQTAIASAKTDFENGLISTYEMTWFELDRASQLITLYHSQTEKTNQVLNLLLTAYSNSGKDFEEVLRMQQELLKYQMAETTAIKDYYTALAKLDYLTAKSE